MDERRPMSNDEDAIRELVSTWQHATAAGDLSRLLSLMAEDVVFLTAGQPPMRGRDAFAAGFQALIRHHRIDATSEIQEVLVAGNWAYCWNRLAVTVTPLEAGPQARRAGDALTILRKNPDATWVIFRDANMLAVAPPQEGSVAAGR